MAEVEKVKSTDQIIQALDALSNLSQAGATRRSTSLPLPRSKDGAVDAAGEPRPRVRRRLSPRSPLWSKPNKLDLNEVDVDEEEGDDAALVIVIKSPTAIYRRTVPFRSRSKLDKKEGDADDDEYDSTNSTNSSTQSEADGEKTAKGTMTSWSPIRAMSLHNGSMRRMGCLFSVEVAVVQGLPPSMNGLRVAVTVHRKETRDGAAQTMPARVQLGAAYFDEALYVRCHLYGTGGGSTGKPISFEPRPFVLSLIAINAPELDFGRSTVDLSLFAKEFTDTCQQGECVRQWDMVFPLAGKAKGGELVVKLELQSIDDAGAASYSPRKLRRSPISNMLTTTVTRRKTPKIGVIAQGLQGIDSFMLDEPEPEPALLSEVKEMQQKEPEREASELTPVTEVKGEQQKDLEHQSTDELTPVAEMVDEEQQKKAENETANELTPVAEMMEEEQQQKELEHQSADEPTPLAEVKEQEQQKESAQEPANELTPVIEVMEEEKQKEPELEPADETTPPSNVKEEEQHKDLEYDPVDEPTSVAEVKEEQQKDLDFQPTDKPTLVVEVKEEQHKELEIELADEPTSVEEMKEEQQKELELEPTDETTPPSNVKEEEQHKELEYDPVDEPTSVAEVKEEQQKDSGLHPTDEPTLVVEMKEEQQKKPEIELANESTSVEEIKEEEQQEEPECEPVEELAPVVEVKEEGQQNEPELESTDEPTVVSEVKEEEQQKELEREPTEEPTLVAEVKEEQQKKVEFEPVEESTLVVEVKEKEQQKEPELEPSDEDTVVVEVKEQEQQKVLEREPAEEPTLVAEVKEEDQQKEPECEPADEPTRVAEVKEEVQHKELEHETAEEPTLIAIVQEEDQQKELAVERTRVAEVKVEKQHKEPECELEHVQEDNNLELPESDIIDKEVEGQEMKVELKEEAETNKGAKDEKEASLVTNVEIVKVVANGLKEKSVEAIMPNNLSKTVVNAVKLMNSERPGEVTRESLQVPEQGANKVPAAKPSPPRLKWRTVALLVPLAILNSKTLGAKR